MTQNTCGFLMCAFISSSFSMKLTKSAWRFLVFSSFSAMSTEDKSTHALNKDGHVSFRGDYGEAFYNKPREFSKLLIGMYEYQFIIRLLISQDASIRNQCMNSIKGPASFVIGYRNRPHGFHCESSSNVLAFWTTDYILLMGIVK